MDFLLNTMESATRTAREIALSRTTYNYWFVSSTFTTNLLLYKYDMFSLQLVLTS